jgi:hypothetical protein
MPSAHAGSVQDRISILTDRGRCHSGSFANSLFHRSHLFSPISRDNPSVLFDLINVNTGSKEVVHKNIYLTLYDLTYRYNYDSQCLKRLQSIIPNQDKGEKPLQDNQENVADSFHSLTRVFLLLADCNLDYSYDRVVTKFYFYYYLCTCG